MIYVRCDKCNEEIDNMETAYNVELTERGIASPEPTYENLYGRGGALRRDIRRLICRKCFEKFARELNAEGEA